MSNSSDEDQEPITRARSQTQSAVTQSIKAKSLRSAAVTRQREQARKPGVFGQGAPRGGLTRTPPKAQPAWDSGAIGSKQPFHEQSTPGDDDIIPVLTGNSGVREPIGVTPIGTSAAAKSSRVTEEELEELRESEIQRRVKEAAAQQRAEASSEPIEDCFGFDSDGEASMREMSGKSANAGQQGSRASEEIDRQQQAAAEQARRDGEQEQLLRRAADRQQQDQQRREAEEARLQEQRIAEEEAERAAERDAARLRHRAQQVAATRRLEDQEESAAGVDHHPPRARDNGDILTAADLRGPAGGPSLPPDPGYRPMTPGPEVYITKGQDVVDTFADLYADLELNSLTPEYMSRLSLDVEKQLAIINTVLEKLSLVPDIQEIKLEFRACRRDLSALIKRLQASLVARRPAPRLEPPPPSRSPTPAAADGNGANHLRQERVRAQEQVTSDEVDALVAEMIRMTKETPTSLRQVRNLEDRARGVRERVDNLGKEVTSLLKDATEASMARESSNLAERQSVLNSTYREFAGKLHEIKAASGAEGAARVRVSDCPPPTFSGGPAEDLFKFLDKFDDYVDAGGYSERDNLRLLKDSCLKGVVAAACENMETIGEIRIHLTDVYGQPRTLFDAKVREFTKLGKCPAAPAWKRRDWYITVNNQITYLERICGKFDLMTDLYFSEVTQLVHSTLPTRVYQDFLTSLSNLGATARTRPKVFTETVKLIREQLKQATSDANIMLMLGTLEPVKGSNTPAKSEQPIKKINSAHYAEAASEEDETTASEDEDQPPVSIVPPKKKKSSKSTYPTVCVSTQKKCPPALVSCVNCDQKHTHSYLCKKYQEASLRGRSLQTKTQGSCKRCLRMDSGLDLANKEAWWHAHEVNCNGDWVCIDQTCRDAPPHRQYHLTLCQRHPRANKRRQDDFIASLDKSAVTPGLSYFYACMPTRMFPAQVGPELGDNNNAIFLLQDLYNTRGINLLLFYDSGCSGAALSDLAAATYQSVNVVPGPTFLNVAAGATLELPGGTDEFSLDLYGDPDNFTLQGLHMPTVTTYMPEFNLIEAYLELQNAYLEAAGEGSLPTVPESIGGKGVDVMIGIQYLYFFPTLLFTLPSGLSIYETKIKTLSGHKGILGGPHSSWSHASTNTLSPQAFMSAELRAYRAQVKVLHSPVMTTAHCNDFDDENGDLINEFELTLQECCDIDEWVDTAGLPWRCHVSSNVPTSFNDAESIGSEVTYRCLRCRACMDCLRGEFFEKQSLQEEAEQAMLEAAVRFDEKTSRLRCKLPFIKDPQALLVDNRTVAETIFTSQMKAFKKNPAMRAAVIQAHDKLLTNGHVICQDLLSQEEKNILDTSSGSYFVPWSCVHKADSISTPFRVVFNASFKTRSGESLNSTLAKGANMLPRIFHLLIRFRARKFAYSGDVSMAYNAVKLDPEHYTFQRYLWKKDLDDINKMDIMIIKTLIYGVRPSGGMTQAGFTKLADHALVNSPHLANGANALKNSTYVDDTLASHDSLEDCKEAAQAMAEILGTAGITVKEFTFSGHPPTEKVSSDGATVGALGYVWHPVGETLSISIKPTTLGKNKRARKPVPDGVSLPEALAASAFTKRAMTSQVAGVFDPLGLVTPITARLKCDLAKVVALKVDWDQPLPDSMIPTWADNLEKIQFLKQLCFPRPYIHPDAINNELELIVSVDASQEVAVSTVHARSQLPDGTYNCCLVASKSKLTHLSTVPRGELRAAVLGASLAREVIANIEAQVKSVIYVSDSMIALYWIKLDTRPLQTAVRNAVIEVRRLTNLDSWFHVASANNVADIGTRQVHAEEVGPNSEWVTGRPWMSWCPGDYPIRSIEQIKLEADDMKAAMAEIKAPDICGINLPDNSEKIETRYAYSKYIVDPCVMRWPKAVRVLAFVYLFVEKTRGRLAVRGPRPLTRAAAKKAASTPLGKRPLIPKLESRDETVQIPEELIERAELYYYRKATKELRQFSKKTDYEPCSTLHNGVLKYTSRILDGHPIADEGEILGEVKSLHFARPVIDRYSPIAYSIMTHVHQDIACHANPVVVLRESRSIAFIIRGRDLANEIAEACTSCRRFKMRMIETEMGKQHPSTLTIAPAFFHSQVDMAGPWQAMCEHNCRSKVKVYALIFKCPTTTALAVYAMPAYSTSAFLQAYTRHACRYGHPAKLFIDAGSQLLKASREAKYSWAEISAQINSKHGVGFEHEVCPPFAHNFNGAVERSVREIKKLFDRIFSGLRLQLMSYESAFAYVANMLNNLPICLGSRLNHLGHRDVLTPNRLIVGRNNLRAASSIPTVQDMSRISEHLEEVEKAWWTAWEKERISDYVPQPKKWKEGNSDIQHGDIVVFPMESENATIGTPNWRTGRVTDLVPGHDGRIRRVKVEYQNEEESVFRTVTRDTRHLAVVHRETDLELTQRLNAAAKSANFAYLMIPETRRLLHLQRPEYDNEEGRSCKLHQQDQV